MRAFQLPAHLPSIAVRRLALRNLNNFFHPSGSRFLSSTLSTRPSSLSKPALIAPSYSRSTHNAPFPRPTHHCGALSHENQASKVILAGRLQSGRKAGKKVWFFPLRDSLGTTQLVVTPKIASDAFTTMPEIPPESTVLIQGIVNLRPENQRRPVPAGDVEVLVTSCTLLNAADPQLPFDPSDIHNLANEDLRLRYRYLDLRRPVLSDNLRKRSRVAHIVRNVLHSHDFVEVETPMLLKSTPEGAREFLVPTRKTTPDVKPETLFYALPQSPQQPKQLLIVSGAVDRYYQIARCFRDEDGRKDRQPEFTQIDMEMAWVSWGNMPYPGFEADQWRIGGREVKDIIEKLIRTIWSEVEGVQLPEAFRVLTYTEAMNRFGSDKPDTRFGLEIQDITPHLPGQIQDFLAQRGEIVEALIVSKTAAETRRFYRTAIDSSVSEPTVERLVAASPAPSSRLLEEICTGTSLTAPLDLPSSLGLQGGEVLWLSRRPMDPEGGSTALGRIRLALASQAQSVGDLELSPEPHFLWITEFPLFTRADEDKDFLARGRWSSSHHPFTAPMWQDIQTMYEGRIEKVRGQHYDLVLNGVEIGGGSVRVHDPAMQEYIFSNVLQLDQTEKASFNHLLHALRCGAPPHGGIALGFDRLMAILCKTNSIRDVIAFPKTSSGTDLLFQSPAPATPEQLSQYGITTS